MVSKLATYANDTDFQFDMAMHHWDAQAFAETVQLTSAKMYARANCIRDIQVGDTLLDSIDIFPAKSTQAPIVIYIHGGWWHLTDRTWWAHCARGLVDRGFTVVLADYAPCPVVRMPSISATNRSIVRWAFRHAGEINGDRRRIYVMGHSAGGHQAAMMGVTRWDVHGLPSDVVKAVLPISGVFELEPFKGSWLQGVLQLTLETVVSESPLRHVFENAPPLLAAVGDEESDAFKAHGRALVDEWRSKGNVAEFVAIDELDHNAVAMSLSQPDSELVERAVAFFK